MKLKSESTNPVCGAAYSRVSCADLSDSEAWSARSASSSSHQATAALGVAIARLRSSVSIGSSSYRNSTAQGVSQEGGRELRPKGDRFSPASPSKYSRSCVLEKSMLFSVSANLHGLLDGLLGMKAHRAIVHLRIRSKLLGGRQVDSRNAMATK